LFDSTQSILVDDEVVVDEVVIFEGAKVEGPDNKKASPSCIVIHSIKNTRTSSTPLGRFMFLNGSDRLFISWKENDKKTDGG
jgi:hypothetical protein